MVFPADLPGSADVVIVGAGSAGCVLAERLSRDPDRRVLLVEAGPGRWPDAGARNLRRLPIGPGSEVATQLDESSGLPVTRGRGWGGSSIVNGGYFLRRHREDFDDWLTGWDLDDVISAYDELDGGDDSGSGGTMSVSPFADDELGDLESAFEKYWAAELPVRAPSDPWPIVGVNRVRSNRVRENGTDLRMTAGEAYLRPAASRENLLIVASTTVERPAIAGRDVTGVIVDGVTVGCDEVILCAGTVGTARILLSAGVDAVVPDATLRGREHREVLVGYRARTPARAGALLKTVVHTVDGCEIRCYSNDFAHFIDGVPVSAPSVGIAGMVPASDAQLRFDDGRFRVELGLPTAEMAPLMTASADAVVEMLTSADFAGLVEPGSVRVDPVLRTSQHLWGTMPMGTRTDWLGGVHGIRGLRIVDGSILPTDGRSGPHATIMMLACRIGDLLAAR